MEKEKTTPFGAFVEYEPGNPEKEPVNGTRCLLVVKALINNRYGTVLEPGFFYKGPAAQAVPGSRPPGWDKVLAFAPVSDDLRLYNDYNLYQPKNGTLCLLCQIPRDTGRRINPKWTLNRRTERWKVARYDNGFPPHIDEYDHGENGKGGEGRLYNTHWVECPEKPNF